MDRLGRQKTVLARQNRRDGGGENLSMDLINDRDLVSYLRSHGLWSQKKLGQNFLVDKGVLGKIVEAAELQPADTVLEIGPGVGTLTRAMAPKIQKGLLLAVEKDYRLIESLRQKFKNAKWVKIIHEDIRRFDLCSIEGEYKVVANIPYYLTSPLIRKLLEGRCSQNSKPQTPNSKEILNFNNQTQTHVPQLIVLTVQKEVAERMTARPGDSNRGILTVMVELLANAEIIEEILRTSFYPEPVVDSAIVRLRPREHLRIDYQLVIQVAKAGFSSKRRQLHNSLAGGLRISPSQTETLLKQAGIEPQKRAEDLTVGEWQNLAKIWQKTLEKSH